MVALNDFFSKPENRGFVQAYLGNFLILAICTNTVVWEALSYAQAVSPLLASFSLSLALQEDSGQNVKYALLRTVSVSIGGAVGLLVLYLVYWANGSSFEPTLAKGSLFVVLVACILSMMTYFFRPPIWSAAYKSVLIGGIAICLVGGAGYWSGNQPLPLIYAFILANMMIGLVTGYVVAHAVLPIRKSVVVRQEINKALEMLKPTAKLAAEVLHDKEASPTPMVPVEVGAILIKCRVMLLSSVYMEHQWSCLPRFPIQAHLRLLVVLRKYVSTYATLLDVIRSEHVFVTQPGIKVLSVLVDELGESFAFFSAPAAISELDARRRRVEKAVLGVMGYLDGLKNETMFLETQGSSRAAMALLACLGSLVLEMFPVVAECYGDHLTSGSSGSGHDSGGENAMLTNSDTFPRHVEQSFKYHRGDPVSKMARGMVRGLHLRPQLLKAVLQAAVAISTACVLLVCNKSYYGLGEHALWVLITVWVFSAQSTFGSVVLKAVNRVVGTIIAGTLAYAIIYLVYILNGLSYANRAPKYIFMTLLYPLAMAFLHRAMIRARPQWKYCFYVSKVTLAITTLAAFNEETPSPSVPAWRVLAVLIGIGIEFVVKTLVFYRETSTTMRHRIQEILKSLSRGGWGETRWRAATATKINDLEKLEELVLFEDKIAAFLHLPLFDRRVINRDSMPVLRRLLRLVLNRMLTIMYLQSSLQALGTEHDHLHVEDAVKNHLCHAHTELIPACLEQLGVLFGTRHQTPQLGRNPAPHSTDLLPDPFVALRSTIDDARKVNVTAVRSRSRAGEHINIARLTWTCGLICIMSSLADAVKEMKDFLTIN